MYVMARKYEHQWRNGFDQYGCLCVQGRVSSEWFVMYSMFGRYV